MKRNESDGERREWTERDPAGVRYRVVIAPRGTSLKGGSVATDFVTVVAELIASTVASVVAQDGTWKVGVMRTKSGIERFVHKERLADLDTAMAEADRVRSLIRDGRFR